MRIGVSLLLGPTILLAGMSVAEGPTQPPPRPRRLYFGAPPTVPHDLGPDMSECLVCHGEADTGAPLTPHPTRLRCQQCHLPASEDTSLFRSSRFIGLTPPARAPRPQPYGPPVVPHPVLLRENCLACHAPGARADVIATTHPERLRCQQCHIPQRPGVVPFPNPSPRTAPPQPEP